MRRRAINPAAPPDSGPRGRGRVRARARGAVDTNLKFLKMAADHREERPALAR